MDIDKIFSGKIEFIFGADKAGVLPKEFLPEIAFIGKSNVGKSSLINSLTGRKALARVSNTPGRTKQINFFDIASKFYLVDLPGYGYAEVSKKEHDKWEKLILSYLESRKTLKLALVLIDSRRGFKDNDLLLLEILEKLDIIYWIIFTKIDKITDSEKNDLQVSAEKIVKTNFTKVIYTHNRGKDGTTNLRSNLSKLISSKYFKER